MFLEETARGDEAELNEPLEPEVDFIPTLLEFRSCGDTLNPLGLDGKSVVSFDTLNPFVDDILDADVLLIDFALERL